MSDAGTAVIESADAPPSQAGDERFRVWRAVSVRLRFFVIVGVAAAAVAGWEAVDTYWRRLAHGAGSGEAGSQVVAGGSEYFCPMDPGVVGDWPTKCPICNMTLVRRPKGEAAPLPDGVQSRMQLAPYRLQLAGVRTSLIEYRPLAMDFEAPGLVRTLPDNEAGSIIEARVFAFDRPWLAVGRRAVLEIPGHDPVEATIRSINTPNGSAETKVELQTDHSAAPLAEGQAVRVRFAIAIAEFEPFLGAQSDPPPLGPKEPRRLFRCVDHSEVVREKPGKCPKDDRPLTRTEVSARQRVRWWCPMHPKVVADRPGATCAECGGMVLVPRVITYAPKGTVLAVPETAVVDTGSRRMVYVERMAGMFDGVEVDLGPRCGDDYPVIRGLNAGDRVVTTSAFLVDAETRLSPALAAAYFGASNGTGEQAAQASVARSKSEKVEYCPVTGKPLGSMGPPVKVAIAGRTVSLCCAGCEPALRKDPQKYLPKLLSDSKRRP